MNRLHVFETMGRELFASVGQSIGIHVLMLIMEHALWQTKHKYEEAMLIRFSEEGIDLGSLESLAAERAEEVAREFIMAIIATLGKLVGMQMAQQLAEELHLHKEVEDA